MKSIFCCAILLLPAAYGAPRKTTGNSTATAPPKARVVIIHPMKAKLLVSTAGTASDGKAKPTQATVPKVVAARAIPSYDWRISPKFQKTGKEDTTYGFIFKRPF